jgi:3'-5' exoribonuclease
MQLRSTFLASDCAVRRDSRGAPYLSLRLVDRTGSVDTRMWKLPPELSHGLSQPEYVYVEGVTHEYRGMLQVKLEKMRTISPCEVDEGDYLPATVQDREALRAEVEATAGEFENEPVRRLFETMVGDEEFWEAFCNAPAAKAMHHACIGGLLEHSVNCLRVAKALAEIYPVDRDLLLFGVIFHDVGKVRELSWHGGFGYTTEGRLLGHVVLGERIVRSFMERIPDFPEELALHISHILLAHQGEIEYGSPKRPKTLEAILVHFVDNMDARAAMYLETTRNVSPGGWSHHDNPLDRALYVSPEGRPPAGGQQENGP